MRHASDCESRHRKAPFHEKWLVIQPGREKIFSSGFQQAIQHAREQTIGALDIEIWLGQALESQPVKTGKKNTGQSAGIKRTLAHGGVNQVADPRTTARQERANRKEQS